MRKILLLLFLSVLYGCSEDILPIDENQHIEKQLTKSGSESTFQESKFGEPMVLGEKVQNPYSVKSLRQESEKMRSAVNTEIIPTHYYVRFLPENNHEYSLLLKSVRFFPFPLDRKIVKEGGFYRDPDPANIGKRFSWQYAVVSVNDQLPQVHYEILDEICMPEDMEPDPRKGFEGTSIQQSSVNRGSGASVPQQHKVVVRIWDLQLGQYIPLQGLQVNVINTALCVSLTGGVTDQTGTAVMERPFTVTEDLYYNIFWSDGKKGKWFITDKDNNQLFYNVKIVSDVTYIDIPSKQKDIIVEALLATIHRASHRTYYIRNSSLLPPAHEDAIQIAYMDENHPDHAGFSHGYLPDSSFINVEIFGRTSKGSLKHTSPVFNTTAHELGHINRSVMVGSFAAESIIGESWAAAVEKCIVDAEFASYGYSLDKMISLPYVGGPPAPQGQYNMKDFIIPSTLNHQRWPYAPGVQIEDKLYLDLLPYSPVFIDLIDDNNQRDYYYGRGLKNNWQDIDAYIYKDYPNDKVKDFTIRELQTLLKTVSTLEELRDQVKQLNDLHGNSKMAIDILFEKYIVHWRKYYPKAIKVGEIHQE